VGKLGLSVGKLRLVNGKP